VLIQVANDFHRRHALAEEGIAGGDGLRVDGAAVMRHVRVLRDRFVRGVMADMSRFEDKLLRGRARFASPTELVVASQGEQRRVRAQRVVVATGSKPIVPAPWREFSDLLIDTDGFFELESLPSSVAVVGLGVIGLELGQALHRLGVSVQAFTLDKAFGGLSDPEVQEEVYRVLCEELPVTIASVERLQRGPGGLRLHSAGRAFDVDRALVTMGRRPVLDELGLAAIDAPLDDAGRPRFDPTTFQLGDLPIFVAGDANAERPLLHEASDEGRIAGYNAARPGVQCFRRRTPLAITFSEPNLAVVGQSYAELSASGEAFVVGQVSFRGQGRAIVKRQEHGLLRVYAARDSGRLLGAELAAPDGEHLAHLLAWAIASRMTASTALSLPFYHPVIEEGLRTALRDAASKADASGGPLELLRCADPPVGC